MKRPKATTELRLVLFDCAEGEIRAGGPEAQVPRVPITAFGSIRNDATEARSR
jgi:hypothetical protein